MKFLVVLAVAVACANADVAHLKDDAYAPIVKSSYDITPEGAFQYAYETGNGIYAQASGSLKQGPDYPYVAVQGAYKYTAPDGQNVELSYTADEEGYKPVGSHLPVGPDVPEYIVRSLAYIASQPARAVGSAASSAAAAAAGSGYKPTTFG